MGGEALKLNHYLNKTYPTCILMQSKRRKRKKAYNHNGITLEVLRLLLELLPAQTAKLSTINLLLG